MKKILFFTDGWFLNFGIAKHLQNKNEYELFSIINVEEKAKKFFQQQKIVLYKKIWFFQDSILTELKKPDVNYLRKVESKYNINLWELVYSDRDFLSYNDKYKYNDNEILSLVEKECKFFERVLDYVKPDYLSIFLTTVHYQELLRIICKARGVKILMLGPARFGNRSMISQEGVMLDEKYEKYNDACSKTFSELREYIIKFDATKEGKKYTKEAFEEKGWERYTAIIRFFLTKHSNNYPNLYYNFGRTRFRILKNKIINLLRKKHRYYFINKHFEKNIVNLTNFIYFPLQMEPERIILMNSRFFTNQLAIITNISKSLPVDYKLLVKEHPVMKVVGWRNTAYYKEIMNLPNVKLIHPSASNVEIIKNSSMVITIAGTTGLEASFYGKPVITFTDQFYSCLPSVHKIQKIEDLPYAIRTHLKTEVDANDINNFIRYIENHTFEFDYMGITLDFTYRFGFKGPIMDAELPFKEIELFLNDYESEFEILTNEHIKKIKKFEAMEK